MKTDTRYDDATLQAAIDGACQEVATSPISPHNAWLSLRNRGDGSCWPKEAPDRLSLARALLARLPEPANAELDVFRSFFGRASVVLQQLDGLGDNGDTENFIERLQKLLEWKCTAAEKTAVESLMQSQGLTALQVLRQALRHYQMAVQGKPTADGKTPGQVAHLAYLNPPEGAFGSEEKWQAAASAVLTTFGGQQLAEAQAKLDYVHNMGLRFGMMTSSDKPEPYLAHTWTDDSDHEHMFREWSASIGGQASLEAGIKRMESVPADELDKHYWDGQGAVDSVKACDRIRARLIAAASDKPIRQPPQAEYYLPKIPNPLSQPAVEAAKPAYVGYMTDEMPADPYADKPKAEPVLVPLDASDIRATDEFRLIQSPDTIYTVIRWDSRCILFQSIGLENYSDISRHYLRRQHGSEEWKHCTKKKK